MDISFMVVAALAAVMALTSGVGAGEGSNVRGWFETAFLGTEPEDAPPSPPGLELVFQDYGELRMRRSVLDTPLKVGNEDFVRGLGTHANSEIRVGLPHPGKSFSAQVGVDNNYDTSGSKGSVVFSVEAEGREVFRSKVLRGGDAPVPVKIDLNGASKFILKVFDGGDGPFYDQSDWGEASVTLSDGSRIWLDEMQVVHPPAKLSDDPPFSFTYAGKPSSELLSKWHRTQSGLKKADGRETHTVTYKDASTGLEVSCEATRFEDFPAVDWVLRFSNTGSRETPIVESVHPLDMEVNTPPGTDIVLHRSHGSTCAETDFLPVDEAVKPQSEINLAPNGGRSSDGVLPYFNLQWKGGGLAGAVGWSGQWAMKISRGVDRKLSVQAGQQTTRFVLRPGESVRTPRILVVMYQGDDPIRGNNLIRKLQMDRYAPKVDGKTAYPPVAQNTWFAFNQGNEVNEKNQLEAIERMSRIGIEAFWLDAGWFEGGWPAGAGSWVPKKEAFPRGLRPLGDAAHKKGMKFVLWFEPERVNPQSRIAKEHPEWVMHSGDGDGLFNLGIPEARVWLTDFLSKCIEDWGIDVYRNDFNIDPLRFWQAADAPDRQGISEAKYIEGLYAMWDELIRRHPGLIIDNCASGGRRIDLEMCTRSIPFWRSDTQCFLPAKPVWDQVQAAGLYRFVPLHAAGLWSFDPYMRRSIASGGASICPDGRSTDFDVEQAKLAIKEAKELRPLYQGDFYPLTEINLDELHWCGWQFDRPDIKKGMAVFFRRSQSPYPTLDAHLKGLDPKARYRVEWRDEKKKAVLTGSELANMRVQIDSAPGSALLIYEKVKDQK